jgi:hypothetical protein
MGLQGEQLVAHQCGLVELRQVTATGHGHDPIPQEGIGLTAQARTQHPILISPEHPDRLGRQGIATAGKATGLGKGGKGASPPWTGEVEGGDLQFGGPHTGVGIGKGAAAKTAPHPGQGEETYPQGRQGKGKGAGHPPEARRIQQQQRLHLMGPTASELQGHRAPHGGSDHTEGRGQAIQDGFEMGQHSLGSIGPLFRSGGEAKAIEVGDHQGVGAAEQGNQAPKLQKGTVEAVQQKQGGTIPHHRHGPLQRGILPQGGENPPLHLGRQGPGFGIQQRPGGPFNERLGTGRQTHPTGWPWVVVVTRAARRSGGVTGKGR